jgi:hypothetical protein
VSETTTVPFRRGAIAPVEAFSEAWRRIRDRYWLFVGIAGAGLLMAGLGPLGLLMGPMMCGIYGCYRHHFQGRPVRFTMLFEGFETPPFLQSFIATLIVMVVTTPMVLVAMIAGLLPMMLVLSRTPPSQEPPPALFLGMAAWVLVLLVMMVVAGVFFAFAYPLLVDRRVSGVQAVVLSARAALGNLGGLLGLTAISFGMGMAGMCCCYVGAFLVMPITFGATMVAYEQVFGLSSPAEAASAPNGALPPA